MLYDNLVGLSFIFISSFFGLHENEDMKISINRFSSSSLIITEMVKEDPRQGQRLENKPSTIAQKVKQETLATNEVDQSITIDKQKSEQLSLSHDKEKPKSRRHRSKNKRKIKRRSSKDLLIEYKKLRAQAEIAERDFLSVGYNIKYKPTALVSKNYWIYRLFPDIVWNAADESENPDKYLEDFHQSYRTLEEPTKEEIDGKKKIKWRRERRRRWKRRRTLLKYKKKRKISDMKPETLRSVRDVWLYPYVFKDYYRFSWKNVIKYGPTFRELENALFILAFIRFCIYTILYDIKTAFIICSIGLISSIILMILLYDAILIPFRELYLCPQFFRLLFEEYLNIKKRNDYQYFNDIGPIRSIEINHWKSLKSELSNWINSGINQIMNNLQHVIPSWISDAFYDLELTGYFKMAKKYFESTIRPNFISALKYYGPVLKTGLIYHWILRMGKSLIPYHIQWYLMFYLTYMNFGRYIWTYYENSSKLLYETLIPERRIYEIQLMNLIHSSLIGAVVYLIMFGMLHAVFSQYFYIPLWVLNIEAHIGKRPKDDIYSGGYTSWQDEISLWEPSWADYKIWFGFLGKGPNDQNDRRRKRKRRRNKKKPK